MALRLRPVSPIGCRSSQVGQGQLNGVAVLRVVLKRCRFFCLLFRDRSNGDSFHSSFALLAVCFLEVTAPFLQLRRRLRRLLNLRPDHPSRFYQYPRSWKPDSRGTCSNGATLFVTRRRSCVRQCHGCLDSPAENAHQRRSADPYRRPSNVGMPILSATGRLAYIARAKVVECLGLGLK
jgi:hypothetical protein